AADAIAHAEIVEKTVDDRIVIRFEYPLLNEVMRVLKQYEEVQWKQDFRESCRMDLSIRRSLSARLSEQLSSLHGVTIVTGDEGDSGSGTTG
ncbi:MAG TPA: YigZ family protein, partial [Proteiniphilum sp.]|nr:YigZ family protein [Proteiniphilum sp.]